MLYSIVSWTIMKTSVPQMVLLDREIDATREHISLQLDLVRNRVITTDLIINTITMSLTIGTHSSLSNHATASSLPTSSSPPSPCISPSL